MKYNKGEGNAEPYAEISPQSAQKPAYVISRNEQQYEVRAVDHYESVEEAYDHVDNPRQISSYITQVNEDKMFDRQELKNDGVSKRENDVSDNAYAYAYVDVPGSNNKSENTSINDKDRETNGYINMTMIR